MPEIAMIEVEKKFVLNKENTERLIQGAMFLTEKVFTDTYYDTDDYALTGKDIWLRARNGKFELKTPLQQNSERIADQYVEIEDDNQIREKLGLPKGSDLLQDLQKAGYEEFCMCKTTRKKYKREPFIIDLDMVEFENFVYHIGEIELMVEKPSEAPAAAQQIIEFAKKQKLTLAPVRGKVVEYLKQRRPEHYEALVKNGVVKEI